MTKPPNKLLEGPILRSLLTLAVPIVLTNVLQSAYQIIDAFWVGRLGGAAVAAVSVSFPVMFLMFAVGAGLSIAGSTLTAQYVGARNDKMVSHVAGQTLLMVISAAIVLGLIGYAVTPSLLRLMNVAPDVYAGALGFMRVSFIGLAFNFAFFVFQGITRSIGKPSVPVFIVLATVFLNFAINPLMIFGWGPIPGHGVMGAALTTLITQALASIVGVFLLQRGLHGVHVRAHDFIPDFRHIKRAFFLGLPASLDMSARAVALMMMTFLVSSFGTLGLAAYGVGGNILQAVAIIPGIGLSIAVAALAGQNIGAGNIKRAEQIGRLGAWLGFFALTGFGIVVFLLASPIVAFFVPNDAAVISEGAHFLRINALSWGFYGAQFALIGVFRAAGSMMISMMLTVVSQWVLQFPLAYVLSKHTTLGVEGVYWSLPIATVLTFAVTVIVFVRGSWRRKKLLTEDERLTNKVTDEILSDESPR
ncbi:putative efflux protein, MATE family [Enhydrobacter aerosaccus]|uniref:Putative efflux protein, MATE family n=1 Tax=Enhydrobacter aerosaccus TaxID=225324 RepID=A0A1T4S7Q1_9HYPH|nr:MATE family efflux transporter [Enhydrobacter aerosaccus]SKA24350.1 putative efflux protein, MATE family [Enhydrobacter aerosaccus]